MSNPKIQETKTKKSRSVKYKSYEQLKKEIKGLGITARRKKIKVKNSNLKSVIILSPTKKYIKNYGEGDEQKAIDDLSKWYGLIGTGYKDGHIIMNVKPENNDD